MKKCFRFFIVTLFFVTTLSCTKPNAFSGLADTTTDDALYIQAQQDMNNLDWDDAITIMTTELSSSYRSQSNVVESLAGAYAGRCGLNFVDLLNNIKQANSSTVLFSYIMQAFQGVSVNPADCETAISTMETLGTVNTRTTDENLFMAILGMTRVGVTMTSALSHTTADGGTDASYSVCNNYVSGSATDGYTPAEIALGAPAAPAQPDYFLTDAQMQTIAAGIGLIFENSAALTSTLATEAGPLITAIANAKTECESIAGAGNCTVTAPASVSSELIYVYRVTLDTASMGVGSCDPTVVNYNAANFCCPALQPGQ